MQLSGSDLPASAGQSRPNLAELGRVRPGLQQNCPQSVELRLNPAEDRQTWSTQVSRHMQSPDNNCNGGVCCRSVETISERPCRGQHGASCGDKRHRQCCVGACCARPSPRRPHCASGPPPAKCRAPTHGASPRGLERGSPASSSPCAAPSSRARRPRRSGRFFASPGEGAAALPERRARVTWNRATINDESQPRGSSGGRTKEGKREKGEEEVGYEGRRRHLVSSYANVWGSILMWKQSGYALVLAQFVLPRSGWLASLRCPMLCGVPEGRSLGSSSSTRRGPLYRYGSAARKERSVCSCLTALASAASLACLALLPQNRNSGSNRLAMEVAKCRSPMLAGGPFDTAGTSGQSEGRTCVCPPKCGYGA